MLFSSWLRIGKLAAPAAYRRTLCGTLAAPALLLLGLVAPAGADAGDRTPDLGDCQDLLQVPPGNKVAFHVYAAGVQIYRSDGSKWVFSRPEAVLFADPAYEGLVGIHYAGPTWESVSGSLVVGTVLRRCTPNANAIQWLLLAAVHTEGPGIFHGVTYIQRLYTEGGTAPAYAGEPAGEEVRVAYAAEYYFYRADD